MWKNQAKTKETLWGMHLQKRKHIYSMFPFKVEQLSYFAGQLIMYQNTLKCFRRGCPTKWLRHLINYNRMQKSRPAIIFSHLLNTFFAIFEQHIWGWVRFWIAWISFTPLPFFLPLLLLVIYRKFYFNYKATTKTYKQKYKNWISIIVN